MLVLFFESICFPTIFTLSIRGLGKHTKTGSTVVIGSVIGGAIVPPLLAVTADHFNNTRTAMFVPLVFFVAAYSFPLGVNLHAPTRRLMDGFLDSSGEAQGEGDAEKAEVEGEVEDIEMRKRETCI